LGGRDAHDLYSAWEQQSNPEIRKFIRCELFEKPVKGFFRESSEVKKLSYNARARAHISGAPPFSELYPPNTTRFENLMLKSLSSTLRTLNSVQRSCKRWSVSP
jgi:hypothetical protein